MSSALTDHPDAGGKDYGNREQAGTMINIYQKREPSCLTLGMECIHIFNCVFLVCSLKHKRGLRRDIFKADFVKKIFWFTC